MFQTKIVGLNVYNLHHLLILRKSSSVWALWKSHDCIGPI